MYARHPLTRVMAFGYAFNEEPVLVSRMGGLPEPAVIDHVANGGVVVAHNAPFEWVIWNHAWRREFPQLPELKASQLLCTMAMSYSMAMPGSLENAAHAAGINMQKDMKGQRVMLQLAQPREILDDGTVLWWEPEDVPEKFEQMYQYCGVDVEVERGLTKRLMRLSPKEFEVWLLDHKINQRGVQVDLSAAEKALALVEFEQERLNEEMKQITQNGVATCTATGQLTDWLKWQGVEVDGVAKNDVADLLDNPLLPDHCRRALLLRQEAAKSSTAKLKSILTSACEDRRVRGLFQYHGAGTGRWAGRRIQLQNLPRPRLNQNHIEDIFNIFERLNA